jgi:hypothetical protein
VIAHGLDPALRSRLRADTAAATASRPALVTIAKRPSVGTGRRGHEGVSRRTGRGLFFARGLDDPNHVDRKAEIPPCKHRIFPNSGNATKHCFAPTSRHPRACWYTAVSWMPETARARRSTPLRSRTPRLSPATERDRSLHALDRVRLHQVSGAPRSAHESPSTSDAEIRWCAASLDCVI